MQKTPLLKTFAEKSRVQSVTSSFVDFSLNLDLRGNLTIILHRFLWQPCTPPTSIFRIPIFVRISLNFAVSFWKFPNSFSEDFGWPRPGRIWSFLERDVFGRPKLWIFGIHCVWCQMPWPNDLAACLSQICLSSCPWVNLLHLSRCLCVFSYVFLWWFTSLSLSFIHSDYALTNLPSKFGELQLWLHPTFIRLVVFLKRWLIFFRIKDSSPPMVWPGIGPDGTPEIPHERVKWRKGVFFF